MRNTGLDEAQAGIMITGRKINNLKTHMTSPYGRKQRRARETLSEIERRE